MSGRRDAAGAFPVHFRERVLRTGTSFSSEVFLAVREVLASLTTLASSTGSSGTAVVRRVRFTGVFVC